MITVPLTNEDLTKVRLAPSTLWETVISFRVLLHHGGDTVHAPWAKRALRVLPGTSTPYVHVEDTRDAFEKALREGAEEVLPPTRMMEGVSMAIVRAPGGVQIGFSGP
jgi:uncharacterized glyoxalase superfamily protein PhnB